MVYMASSYRIPTNPSREDLAAALLAGVSVNRIIAAINRKQAVRADVLAAETFTGFNSQDPDDARIERIREIANSFQGVN